MLEFKAPALIEYGKIPRDNHLLFLGGGISNCPDWQTEAVNYLSKYNDNLVIANPRRDLFDMKDPAASKIQIEWEFRLLRMADWVLFWFPCETLCPITLFELGSAMERNQKVFVGCHPDYQRLLDVQHQVRLRGKGIKVVTSLADLLSQIDSEARLNCEHEYKFYE